jgi:hypothetical protein
MMTPSKRTPIATSSTTANVDSPWRTRLRSGTKKVDHPPIKPPNNSPTTPKRRRNNTGQGSSCSSAVAKRSLKK